MGDQSSRPLRADESRRGTGKALRRTKEGQPVHCRSGLNIGQGAADFFLGLLVMLYLLFFLLRDGSALIKRIQDAIPLPPEQERDLFNKFTTSSARPSRAAFFVAALQGALGGLIFWLLGLHAPVLWGVVMGLLALLPAVGAALIWVPAAIYLLATGSIWQGVVLLMFGAFVIGLVDNILRPLLVGKDTKMPDYVVLISTLGGLATFGLNGINMIPSVRTSPSLRGGGRRPRYRAPCQWRWR